MHACYLLEIYLYSDIKNDKKYKFEYHMSVSRFYEILKCKVGNKNYFDVYIINSILVYDVQNLPF